MRRPLARAAALAACALLAAAGAPRLAAAPAPADPAADAGWAHAAAINARAILTRPEDPRAWAGLAAALHAPGLHEPATGRSAAGALARAVADSIAAASPALTDVTIGPHQGAPRITLHGGIDAAALRLTVDPRDATRVFVDLPGATSALARDEFAGIAHGGVRRLLVLQLPATLRLVIQLDDAYAVTVSDDASASLTLAGAPLGTARWSARETVPALNEASGATRARPATIVAATPAERAAAARQAALATTASAARALAAGVHSTTERIRAKLSGTNAAPASATLGAAAALLAAALLAVLGMSALRRRSRRRAGSARAHHDRAPLSDTPERTWAAPGHGRTADRSATPAAAARRLRSARSLIASGHDPVEVARRTRLPRDAARLLALDHAPAR